MIARRWDSYWFRQIQPQQYALLRIAFGLIGLLILAGLSDFDTFWRLDGLINPTDSRVQTVAVSMFGRDKAPVVAFGLMAAAYLLMTLGIASDLTVPLAFMACFTQLSWNSLPLSGANQVFINLLFLLSFAGCGGVWSLDAWWRRRHGKAAVRTAAIWPLRLLRFQVCVIYCVTGLWKLQNVHWRDGSALHYVLSNTQFRRLPYDPPIGSAEWLTLGTYVTLGWELLFPALVLWRPTRWLALGLGVLLHTGMLLTMEVGTFSLVMMASYVAFLDTDTIPRLAARLTTRLSPTGMTSTPL